MPPPPGGGGKRPGTGFGLAPPMGELSAPLAALTEREVRQNIPGEYVLVCTFARGVLFTFPFPARAIRGSPLRAWGKISALYPCPAGPMMCRACGRSLFYTFSRANCNCFFTNSSINARLIYSHTHIFNGIAIYMFIPFILGMDRHRRITEHCLGTCGRKLKEGRL